MTDSSDDRAWKGSDRKNNSHLTVPEPHATSRTGSAGKDGVNASGLDIPSRSRSPDTVSLLSAEDLAELHMYDPASRDHIVDKEDLELDEAGHATWSSRMRTSWRRIWKGNKGVILVLLSQVFGTMMGAATRMLEQDSENIPGMNPFQVLLARMFITAAIGMSYMWYTSVEHFPIGAPEVRWLLVARGLGGFVGVYGFYYGLMYLSLSDATVIGFLSPSLTSYVCSKLLKEPFTRAEQIGGFVSLFGVVLIARPTFVFSMILHHSDPSQASDAAKNSSTSANINTRAVHDVTAAQRLSAVTLALLGVAGATVAYTAIKWIGHRAHPLISVNYFAVSCTVVSTVALAVLPGMSFELPHSGMQWFLLFFIGVVGFIYQFLMTEGLRHEKGSRATNMMFSSMVFAMLFDLLVWGTVPTPLSLVGSALIVGSGVIVALQKEKMDEHENGGIEMERTTDHDVERGSREEGAGLLRAGDVELDEQHLEVRRT